MSLIVLMGPVFLYSCEAGCIVFIKSALEGMARGRACNYIKLELQTDPLTALAH